MRGRGGRCAQNIPLGAPTIAQNEVFSSNREMMPPITYKRFLPFVGFCSLTFITPFAHGSCFHAIFTQSDWHLCDSTNVQMPLYTGKFNYCPTHSGELIIGESLNKETQLDLLCHEEKKTSSSCRADCAAVWRFPRKYSVVYHAAFCVLWHQPFMLAYLYHWTSNPHLVWLLIVQSHVLSKMPHKVETR